MEKIINYSNLRNFAYSNDKICKKPIKGIVISFFGLGNMTMFKDDTPEGEFFAEKGIIYLVPYNNPWAWMNKQAIEYTDYLIEVLADEYGLSGDIPIVSSGGSMGGCAALVYMAYAKRTPVACVANCPVCDLPYHFTERPDLPRTLYSAFFCYDMSMDKALRSASPIHLIEKLPDARYTLFHCDKDLAVNKERHSDRFVEMMKASHRIEYIEVEGRGHCDLPPELHLLYKEKCAAAIENR